MTAPQQQQPADAHARLWHLWSAVLDALIDYFATAPRVRAHYIIAAVGFLRLNGVTAASLADTRGALERLRLHAMPPFKD